MKMQNFNFEKTFALLIGATIGILITAHIIGCGTGVSPEAAKPNYDSIYAAGNDSIKQSVETDMLIKQKFDSLKK